MNKRDVMLSLLGNNLPKDYVPAAFFLHFDPAYHRGPAAVQQHLEFFKATGMDFVKIQFEQPLPADFRVHKAADWDNVPLYPDEFFEPTETVVEGLVKAAKREALILLTLYSPLMWANHLLAEDSASIGQHLKENPAAVKHGLTVCTENVIRLVRGCKRMGVDGFYASTQGGEAFRFPNTDFFRQYIKPTDLAVWNELQDCTFNILHVCDYNGSYDDLTPFLDYPGHVVNCSLHVGECVMTTKEAATLFNRPFMGGLERKAVIAQGPDDEIVKTTQAVLRDAPERFILAADCTVPADTPWRNLKIAIDTAHTHHTP